jgi:hypothetical protein
MAITNCVLLVTTAMMMMIWDLALTQNGAKAKDLGLPARGSRPFRLQTELQAPGFGLVAG